MLKKIWTHLALVPIVWMVRALLSLRYRIEVVGLKSLQGFSRPGGILFLPNHPAEIDPVILSMILWQPFQIRPLVVEHFYHLKGFRFFMDLVKAMPLPTMDTMASPWRAKKVKKQFDAVVDQLKNKSNFLIYPSGRLKVTGMELLGGASFVHNLLKDCPEANVVLVRTTGLWGSQFSRALTGSSPDFGKTLFQCAKILLKNGLFFTPRRRIKIELEKAPSDFPYLATRLELNKYLQNWYNHYPKAGPEPLKLVSYSIWKEQLPEVSVNKDVSKMVEIKPVPESVQQEVFKQLAALSQRSLDHVEREMHLAHDLGLDSLDVVQLYVFLDEHYGVVDLMPGDLQTVEDVLQAAAGHQKEREFETVHKDSEFRWPDEPERLSPEIAEGKTLQEVFLRTCDRMGNCSACVDSSSGLLSYHRLKMAALILSFQFKKIPGTHMGIMLPAMAGTYIVILAVLLAGKIPVMINWTAGVKALDFAVDVTQLSTVISSDRFLDRLENGDLGSIESKLLLMENIRSKITWKDKLKGFLWSKKKASSLMARLGLNSISDELPAVILFTSGTEALPKGVPLSHSNLLSNQRAALSCVNLTPRDIFYAVLPPFHSFGFSMTGLLPLLAGIKAAFSPDPTDSHGLSSDIRRWKPTLFCCAPSFIRALFRVAKPQDLQSLRLVVSGAEKTPVELFEYVAKNIPSAQLIEGYGITECSPVVSLDRPDTFHRGVGKPLPGFEVIVIDSGSQEVLPPGKEGEICIHGPSVFKGYIGSSRNPFIELGGKKWYVSGDRGYLDQEGILILSGRLKRFVKIGGEMVSLGGLEEELLRLAGEKQWIMEKGEGPSLAVSVREKESEKPLIILFTTFTVSKEDVNTALKDSGLGKLVKIAEVRKLDEIPLNGTGKTHYRLLDEFTGSSSV